MVDCGSGIPREKTSIERIDKLRLEVAAAKARAEKLEGALKTIMLHWNDSKLCAKVAMEAMRNENKKDCTTKG